MEKSLALGLVIGGTIASSVGGAFKTLEQRAGETKSKLKKLKIGAAITGDLNKYRSELLQLQAARKEGLHDSEQMRQQIGAVMKKYNTAAEKARKYGISVGQAAAEQKRLEVEIGRTTRAMDRQNTRIRNKRKRGELQGQMMGTVGMVMAAAAPVKAAMDFETTMAEVKKVVNFDTPQQFKAMSKDILQLSTVMPMAASGIGDIVAAAGQSGIAREELLGFAKSAVTMGVAFDLTGDQAGSMMANWRAGMNLSQTQVVNLADAVNHLSNSMNAEAGSLAEVVKRQGAVAMAAGLTETQTASLGAALLSSGTGPERAATALKNLTGALTKGYAATKSQQEAFAALGLDAEEMASSMQNDAKGAILDVFKALEQADAEDRGALVSELFGEESKGAIMPLLANLSNLQKAFSLTADQTAYAGSMQKEYEERSKTTANNLQLLQNQAMRAGVSLGSVLLPTVNEVFGVIGDGAGVISDAAEEFPLLTKVVVGAGVGLAAFKIIALGGSFAMTILSDGLQAAKATVDFFRISTLKSNAALGMQKAQVIGSAIAQRAAAVTTGVATAAQWAWNVAMTANPIGLVVAGVAALVAGGIWLYKTWEPFQLLVDKLWSGFKKLIEWSPIGLLFKAGSMIGSMFGDDKPAVEVGATQTPRSRSDQPAAAPSALPHVAPATRNSTINSNPKITINQAPGQSTDDMRDMVQQELRNHEQRLAVRKRGALHD
jgi:TP901 family phage tail tape measure protein